MENLIRSFCCVFDEKPRAMLADVSLLVLRAGFGCTMLFGHGLAKLLSYGQMAPNFPDPIGLGGPLSLALVIFAEFFCSIAIALGLLTRLVALPLIFNMGVAFFIIHGEDAFKVKELALLYLLVYVVLFLHGPGRFSLDHLLWQGLRDKCGASGLRG